MVSKNFLIFIALFFTALPSLKAEVLDPYDPFDLPAGSEEETQENDDSKTVDELLIDATILLNDERLLDARTKLLKALHKDPKEYRTHMMLSGYYMQHVGHYRLALKYTLQAMDLFIKANGKPPYRDLNTQTEHSHLLYLLSQARLNLDNYQGALDVLDEYSSYGYFGSWYAGTRAWVLMKLSRIDEAIKVARLGILAGSEPGRTLNMLGILLSLNRNREDSLKVFRDAITYELALGESGQPATPLNNSGEVYKEIFEEDKAETAWLKAIRLPDGCEHVLPSLNLSLLYIEQLNFTAARDTMNNFESCVAQFTLRNGEEHRALVHLIRGRLRLHTGNPDKAIEHFEQALEQRQWFGKIGTSVNDLQSAAMISLAQALRAKANHLHLGPQHSFMEWLAAKKSIAAYDIRSWWLMRRATQILTEDLNDLEDIFVRSTDSMIEYPTFGELLARLPTPSLKKRIAFEKSTDNRKPADLYYQTWLAENYLNGLQSQKGRQLISELVTKYRPRYDNLLKTHALILRLRETELGSDEHALLSGQVFNLNRSKLRNHGIPLYVNYQDIPAELADIFEDSPFYLDNSRKAGFLIRYQYENNEHVLSFLSSSTVLSNLKVKGTSFEQMSDKLIDTVFVEDLGETE